ncbi:MAG: alanine--tRNA ligase [Marine Group III euryarchaeote CG-Epi2]|uniref:Alanine--tRNA ligase n=1 Tax=Marine Group III euryarchaeote CG-Epi2 TaxID=1888996 RepID=A0A1J5U6I3_9ARCH|nr:MAG: alanine--tRNA ligase [Marine Group III euryarchaeote CG-Epi2]
MSDGLSLSFFHDSGFTRQKCSGDAPCVEYSFIGKPLFSKPMSLDEAREAFLGFFEEKSHTRINRASVVARWRNDIYLSIASIAVFQPHVTSGFSKPPANPLTISQPCIRLNDLESVGRSGRHLTTFEMMAHHAFNNEEEKIYWQNRTVELCHELYTSLGLEGSKITYKENPWVGGGNGGEALEVLAGGLELATLVFMDLEEDPEGDIELKGIKFKRMPRSIVDTGYGLERLVWASQGTSTIYEAVFPEAVSYLTKRANLEKTLKNANSLITENAKLCGVLSIDYGSDLTELRQMVLDRLEVLGHNLSLSEFTSTIEPLEKVFAIVDHCRSLVFMFGDGIVPSNVKAGYLARMVLRRTVLLLRDLGVSEILPELVSHHIDNFSKTYPELKTNKSHILDMIDLEMVRFNRTLERGRRAVKRALDSGSIGQEKLLELYDSQGLPPSVVSEFAETQGHSITVPDGFLAMVAERHQGDVKIKETNLDFIEIAPTNLDFYQDMDKRTFSSKVLYSSSNQICLENTLFYPEGGGQLSDIGDIKWENKKSKMVHAQKIGDVVVHNIEGPLPPVGTLISGIIDDSHRSGLSRHHTATHLIGAAARKILGTHVWQAGASKYTDRARLDITHHKRISLEVIEKIESHVNNLILEDYPINTNFYSREEADSKYGDTLYQGGAPKYRNVRVVEIPEIDAQACAGTHVSSTSHVVAVKVLRTERIQDGVERIEFSAGPDAIKASQKERALLEETADELGVPVDQAPLAAQKFVKEWKELRNRVSSLEKELATFKSSKLEGEKIGDVIFFSQDMGETDMGEVQNFVRQITSKDDALVAVGCFQKDRGMVILAKSNSVNQNCGKLLKSALSLVGGSGGGKESYAQGACSPDKILEALNEIKKLIS